MQNQDLNIWLIKRIQTESTLRSEERRLDAAKSEYNSERSKYQNVRESFQSTRQRLMNDKEPGVGALDNAKSESFRLKEHKEKLDNIHERLCTIEGKVKRQTVLVLQNKKKLEVLEERINILHGKKAAKKNFKEELEILDSRIQQIVINNQKNKVKNAELDVRDLEPETSQIKESDELSKLDELKQEIIQDTSLNPAFNELMNVSPESVFTDSQCGNMSHNARQQPGQNSYQTSGQEDHSAQNNNREFYEQIQNLSYLRADEADHLNLRYYNKSGNIFELQIKRQSDQGYVIEIKPHTKTDTFSLNNSKSEIINTLKSQGLKLNRITVREYDHAE